MRQNLKILLTTSAASILTFTVVAQENPAPGSGRTGYARDRMSYSQTNRLHSAAKASEVIGMTVKSYQGEVLGAVEDLAVELESGRIVQVILSSGGFLGLGERASAVPPGALHHDAANKVLHLDADKEKVKGAPEFKAVQWAESGNPDHLAAVYAYYGQASALNFIHAGDRAPGAVIDPPARNAEGSGSSNRRKAEGQWMIPASRLGHIQKASRVIGLAVKNGQDENLGSVENLMVDVQAGRIIAIVVSSGGFLGMGNELSAVPPTALRFNAALDGFVLDTSKAELAAAPHFKADQWPDFNQPVYAHGVYRSYKLEPYFTTNTVADADNAGRNVRDRGDRTLTPLDQGNSKADTDMTAEIRKGILAGVEMSVNAKNVKIITQDGRVTLRGPVKNEEERRMIGDISIRIARAENVDNQLELTEGQR